MTRLWQGALLAGLTALEPACFWMDSCFVRGTRVGTPKGRRPIEDLEVGDEVLSFDLASRRFVTRRVAKVIRSLAAETFRLEAGEHAIAGVTASHPFYDAAAGKYVRLDELTVRSQLLVSVADGEIAPRPLGAIARLPVKGEVEIFNLSIEGDEQNYFAEGILVHNKSPPYEGGAGSGATGGVGGTSGTTGGSGGTAGDGGTGGRTASGGAGGATGGTGGSTGGAGGATGGTAGAGGATGGSGAGGATGGSGGT